MKRGKRRVGQAAAERRKRGGALAVGRPSGTKESLSAERAYVMARAKRRCELCAVRGRVTPATDFAHVVARSAGGPDTRFNALATCRACNLAMQGPFAVGRPLVTPIYRRDGVRGFDVEWVYATSKFHYREGDYITIAAGFVPA
jgi:5-methylcytosine-specific restriction endonuclease McrA